MTLAATTIIETQGTSGSTSNGGGFNPANTNMATDLIATGSSGNLTSPTVSSASYAFQSGDVGNWLFIQSGTNWIPGWYKVTAVNAGVATLSAAIGAAVLYSAVTPSVPKGLSTAFGCATVASPTGGVWAMDYSQSASAIVTSTDMVAVTSTTFTDTTNNAWLGWNLVGNIINVTSGTGFTVARWEVVSVSVTAGVGTGTAGNFTSGSTVGTASSTGGHGTWGGALAVTSGQPSNGNTLMAPGNTHFCKATATYSASVGMALTAGSAGNYCTTFGYTTTRMDGGKVTIQATANSLTLLATAAETRLENFILDSNTKTTSICLSAAASLNVIRNVICKNFTSKGISLTGLSSILDNILVTGGTSAASGAISISSGTPSILQHAVISNNSCVGIIVVASAAANITNCIIANNTGSTNDGIQTATNSLAVNVMDSWIYGNGRDGIRLAQTTPSLAYVQNCVIVNNGVSATGYGINQVNTGSGTIEDYNAYYGNSANLNNVAPGPHSITLTGDPSVDGGDATLANQNFAPNNTSGAGASIRSIAFPTTFQGINTANYDDIGGVRHQDPSSAAGGGSVIGSSVVVAGEAVYV